MYSYNYVLINRLYIPVLKICSNQDLRKSSITSDTLLPQTDKSKEAVWLSSKELKNHLNISNFISFHIGECSSKLHKKFQAINSPSLLGVMELSPANCESCLWCGPYVFVPVHYDEPVCQPTRMGEEYIRNITPLAWYKVGGVQPGRICCRRCPCWVDWEDCWGGQIGDSRIRLC